MKILWNNHLANNLRESAYNPASLKTEEQRKSFREEFNRVSLTIFNCLNQYLKEVGEKSPPEHCYGKNSDPYGGSRYIQIEVLKATLWRPDVVKRVFMELCNAEADYMIEYGQDLEDECLPLSFIVMTPSQVVGYFSQEKDAELFMKHKD